MSRTWLALVDERPTDATAAAPLEEAGRPAGFLAAWRRPSKPRREALRADPRLIDPQGDPGWASVVLPPPDVRIPFDDLAVQQARRRVLAGPPPDGVTALMRDASRFAGSITVRRGSAARDLLEDDPFARVFPGRVLKLGAGVLGRSDPLVGPAIERYGSSNPWPGDRFEGPGT